MGKWVHPQGPHSGMDVIAGFPFLGNFFCEDSSSASQTKDDKQPHPKDFKADLKELDFAMSKFTIQAAPSPTTS